jgi:hypothetical protein
MFSRREFLAAAAAASAILADLKAGPIARAFHPFSHGAVWRLLDRVFPALVEIPDLGVDFDIS